MRPRRTPWPKQLRPDGDPRLRRGRRDHAPPASPVRSRCTAPGTPRHARRGADHRGVPRRRWTTPAWRSSSPSSSRGTRRSRPAEGTRGSGGADDIVVNVPAPGDGNGQVLLYAAEDGSLSWHLADDVPPAAAPDRGGERRTYRDPRAVVPVRRAEPTPRPRHPRRHRQEGPQGPGLPARRPGPRQGRRPLRRSGRPRTGSTGCAG